MAPVFFVGKSDSKKRIVQDYRYLQSGTCNRVIITCRSKKEMSGR